jgi:Ca-activated chloride channel family protein
MVLSNAWILFLCLAISIGLSGGLWLLLRYKKETQRKKTVYLANTSRLTDSDEYKSLMSRYRRGIIAMVAFLIITSVSFGVSSAKPVQNVSEKSVKYNRDIVLCLDVSGSMVSVDAEIISKFNELAQQFKGERISLVIFNATSNQVFPLTDDYGYMKEQFDYVLKGLDEFEAGTAEEGYDVLAYTVNGEGSSLIGDGVTACGLSFDDNSEDEKRSRSVILATDNSTNGEELVPLPEAADYLKKNDITMYSFNPSENLFPLEADELETATEVTGGQYFSLTDESAVPTIIDQISSEEASAIEGETTINKTDTPQPWIILGALGFIIIMGLGWRFKV